MLFIHRLVCTDGVYRWKTRIIESIMRKFLLIAYDNVSTYASVSDEDMQAIVAKYRAWTEELEDRGQLVLGEKLKDDAGKAISRSNGSLSITEGPYTEANEVVGGFWILKCDTEDEAIAIASSCPHAALGVLGLKEIDSTG